MPVTIGRAVAIGRQTADKVVLSFEEACSELVAPCRRQKAKQRRAERRHKGVEITQIYRRQILLEVPLSFRCGIEVQGPRQLGPPALLPFP